MRMIKKICSVICAAVIALGGVNIVVTAQDTESQIKYNYKISMESDSDFRMVYGYNGGTISTKKSYVSGKYGNAMQITYPGHEISDPSKRYNGFVMQFKSEPIELANESISMLDLMRDTKNISMWVHTPQTVDHGNGAAEHRVLEIAMEYSSTEGNKKYSKKFQLPNNGEWEYITIPTSAFKSGSVTMDQGIQSDIYTALNQMTIIFPYKDYFGANPTSDTLETPWEEPLKIDEILFDRSTDEVKAITPPSTGEEAYFENANISEVFVKGVKVEDFDKNASSNNIPVPASYTAEDIKKNVTVDVETPTIPKTNTRQELTGASYEITAPESVPGLSLIHILAYNLLFIFGGLVFNVAMAIGLSELRNKAVSKLCQTVVIMPHFLSYVIVSFLVLAFLHVENGLINRSLIPALGLEGVDWYSNPKYWPWILVIVNFWKTTGYGSVVYLAGIAGIDTSLYEAAKVDGASRWQQIRYITLPALVPLMVVLTILNVGKIFNSDFGLFYQVPLNTGALYPATNVISTYVYNMLMSAGTGSVGMASAAAFYQSIVGFILVMTTNFIVKKISPENALF